MEKSHISRVAALVFASVTAIGAAHWQADAGRQPTFASRIEAVRLDVLVTEKGRAVRGLTVKDFEISDNGAAQTPDLVSFEEIPLNVVLAFDASFSVGRRLGDLRDAGRAVLDALKTTDQAALVTFSKAVARDAALTSDVAHVKDALAGISAKGYTGLIDATYASINVADEDDGRGLLILFSDGVDTASWLNEQAAIDAARRSDVVVYAISAGKSARFLGDITKDTGGRLYEIDSTRDLRRVFLAALEEFRQRYLVSYTPRGVQTEGWHKVEVKVKGRRVNVRARPGYGR